MQDRGEGLGIKSLMLLPLILTGKNSLNQQSMVSSLVVLYKMRREHV